MKVHVSAVAELLDKNKIRLAAGCALNTHTKAVLEHKQAGGCASHPKY